MSAHDLLAGKYRLLERLGEGGMGTVFRARDELLDRDVAIKQLRAELASEGSLTERLRAEAVVLSRLSHPCIGALHGLERVDDRLYMVMEYLPGETLEALVARAGPVPWRRAAEICRAVLEALEHAHERGIVHRDIKPANVMVLPDDGLSKRDAHGAARTVVKVMDFGIARVMGRTRHTRQGHAVGTPAYMAPEQLRGEEVDGRADLYALGAVLYELLVGRVAFDADSDYRLMMMQLHDAPPAPGAAIPGLPPALDQIVARAMAKKPSGRYANAATMRAALDEVTMASDAAARGRRLAIPSVRPAAVAAAGAAIGRSLARSLPLSRQAVLDSWARDWRGWATIGCLCAAAALTVRAFSPSITPEPPADLLAADSLAAASGITRGTSVPGSFGASPAGAEGAPRMDAGSGATPDVRPVSSMGPSLPVARSAAVTAPPAPEGGGSPAPRPAAATAASPTRAGRGARGGAASDGASTEPPSPTTPAPGDAERRGQARAAAVAFLGQLASGDATSAARVLGSAGTSGDLLTLIRDRRLVDATTSDLAVTIAGSQGEATAGLDVAWRTAFGGNRRSTLRLAMELIDDGTAWRVGSARVVGGQLR